MQHFFWSTSSLTGFRKIYCPSLPLLTTLFTFIPKSSTSLRPSALPQRTRSPLRRRSAIPKRKGVICTAAQPVARRILITPIWNSVTVQFVGDMLAIVRNTLWTTHISPKAITVFYRRERRTLIRSSRLFYRKQEESPVGRLQSSFQADTLYRLEDAPRCHYPGR